jgi:hypothetical protein
LLTDSAKTWNRLPRRDPLARQKEAVVKAAMVWLDTTNKKAADKADYALSCACCDLFNALQKKGKP